MEEPQKNTKIKKVATNSEGYNKKTEMAPREETHGIPLSQVRTTGRKSGRSVGSKKAALFLSLALLGCPPPAAGG